MWGLSGRRPFSNHRPWETIVGLEVHAQLASRHKLFSPAPILQDVGPNALVDPFDRATPGYLPRLDEECLMLALRAALLFDCQLQRRFTFDRKHYDYPDLPHGYQITQYNRPYALGGWVELAHGMRVPLDRIQIEMDSGKSLLLNDRATALIDLNRAGRGLLEIVTGPVFRSPSGPASEASQLAVAFGRALQRSLRQAGVCLGNLEEAQLRFDVNVSVTGPNAPAESGPLGTRVEIKNLNSFAALAAAIDSEARRQIALLETGQLVRPKETRTWEPSRRQTVPMRNKEGADDYRFIRDYDVPEVEVTDEMIESVRRVMPPTLDEIIGDLQRQYGLGPQQAISLSDNPECFAYFREAHKEWPHDAGLLYNWITIDLAGQLNRHQLTLEDSPVTPKVLAELLEVQHIGQIDRNAAKLVLSSLLSRLSPDVGSAVHDLGLLRGPLDSAKDTIRMACEEALRADPDKAQQVHEGRRSIDYFMGPLVKRFRGQASPKEIRQILADLISTQD